MNATMQTSLKGYELKERIGAGGFGAVYRAVQTTIGREVAIKIILPGLANHPDFIRRFEGEAQFVARLEHPHITPLYDYWRDPHGAYLVMRWLRGGSLRDALRNGPFELRAAALLLDQVAGALSLAHRSGVIHRDIKPGNILLDEDGNAYLTDFGIAKDVALTGNQTNSDVMVGSLDYIAPEQARSQPVSPQTDIYSLGVTLYEALTGHHPFQNVSSVERLYKHINDPLPPVIIRDAAPQVGVNRVIQKATAKNPEHRYEDALAFAADFRGVIGFNSIPTDVVELLTPREQDILQLIIDGLSNKEISQRLTVTLSTVKWYINQIYSKLGVRSRVQAIVRARELNLIVKPGEVAYVSIPTEDFHPENPYKGLRAFQAADHQDFFGREKVTAKLIRRLGEPGEYRRFLAVVGPSGSGKSSLIKAGLIPALWRGDLPGSEKWFVVEMLPGSRPLDELEIALTRVAANQAGNLHEHLERDQYGLARIANLILPDDGSELVLIIDQFEEVFTLVEAEQSRVRFLDLLHTAVTGPRRRVRVIITLRADFYDRPLHYPQIGELVRSRLETIMPLSTDELERAISKPAERVGVAFEPGLVSAIIGDVNYQPGALPLLQYALTELFEQRRERTLTLEAYQAIGGTVGALAKRAEEVYLSLDEASQEITRQIFLRLITLGEGTEDTRRRAPRSELLAVAAELDVIEEIIDTFSSYRLLSLDTDPVTHSPTVEVAHEALLREWERLRTWLDDSRDDIKIQRQLSAMAREWREANEDTTFLARGTRLESFERWAAETRLSLTDKERRYLGASLIERERQAQLEMERQAREKTLERRSVGFLRGLVAVLLLAVLGAFVLTALALSQRSVAQQERDNARRSAAESQYIALTSSSQTALLVTGNIELAMALALQAVRLDPQKPNAQAALSDAAYAPGTIRRFVGHTAAVKNIAVSPDGRTMISASDDMTLILWDIETGAIIRRFEGHTDRVMTVAFSPDGRTILSGANNNEGSKDIDLILWEVETGEIIRRFKGHTEGVWGVAFSPDGRMALSGGSDTIPILWDVETGQIIRHLGEDGSGHQGKVESPVFSPDGRTALTGSWDATLILWDIETGKVIRRFGAAGEGHAAPVQKVVFSPDGRMALSGAQESTIILWDIATGEIIRRFNDGQGWVFGLAFSLDGRTFLSTGLQGTITLWNVDTGEVIRRFQGHTGPAISVAFLPDGRRFVTSAGVADHEPRLWDLEQGQIIRRFAGHNGTVITLARSPDGNYAISTGSEDDVILWDLRTGQEVWRYPAFAWAVAFSPDGKTALLSNITVPSGEEGELILLDVETGRKIRHFDPPPSGVQSLAFNPDGHTAVSGGMGRIIILWDVTTGREIRRFKGYEIRELDHSPEGTWNVGFTPDGRQVLASFIHGTIVVWDTATGNRIHELAGNQETSGYSFGAQVVVTTDPNGAATLWDIPTGIVLRRLSLPVSTTTVQISPDNRLAMSGTVENTTVLWDLQTGAVVRRWSGPNNGAVAIAFGPDGHDAVVGFGDGRVELWRIDASIDELLAWTTANRYIPELTCEQRAFYGLESQCPERPVD